MRLALQSAAFVPQEALAAFTARCEGAGAIVSFTGLVRGEGGLQALEIEHYPGMTERAIGAIMDKAETRWPLLGLTVIHRFGTLAPGAPIVFVAAAAAHRAPAFAAVDFVMDYLKSRAPFWKREIGADGQASWVAAKAGDEAALARWTPR